MKIAKQILFNVFLWNKIISSKNAYHKQNIFHTQSFNVLNMINQCKLQHKNERMNE
jgi:hypothetical protein